jgi:membrane fusion protein (multidrug efflux system)
MVRQGRDDPRSKNAEANGAGASARNRAPSAPDRTRGEPDEREYEAEEPGTRENGADQAGDDSDLDRRDDAEESAGNDDRSEREGEDRPPWYKRPLLAGGLIALVIALAVGAALWWLHARRFEKTDDAFIDVASQHVSPEVRGRVVRVLVNDNQDVAAGDVLVEIDPAEYETRVSQAIAGQRQAEAKLAEARAQQSIDRAQVEEARADALVAETTATNAASDLSRYEKLHEVNAGAASQQQLDNARAAARSGDARLESARKKIEAAEARLESAQSQIRSAQAALESAAANVEEARLELSRTKVVAKLDGRVARKTVAPGNYVAPGTELMAIVPRDVYVTANFKEAQLEHMRARQSVTVHVDAYPDMELTGHVDSVQPATGQAFSVLPAENATGNWVKVVQRVPVKIVFDRLPDDPERRLAPGMSVEVKVEVR